MKSTFYFVNDNGRLRAFETSNERELEHARIQYGEKLFFDRMKCIEDINKPAPKKVRGLSPEEEREQYRWALSQLTEQDKALARQTNKTIDEQQLEFARQQEQ